MAKIQALQGEGAGYVAVYEWRTYRFLLSNGNTIDVRAVTDDSVLRGEIVKIANGKTKITENTKIDIIISGSATLPEPEAQAQQPAPAKSPAKKVAAKKVAPKKAP